MVYGTSGHRGGSLQAIELGRAGDLFHTDAVKWQVTKATPYVPSPLLYEDKLYVFSRNKAILSCYHAQTGKPYFVEQDLEGLKGIYASPVGAAGRVYILGRQGTTQVIANTGKYKVLASNKLDDKIDSTPAIVDNEIYLKGRQYLYCIQ